MSKIAVIGIVGESVFLPVDSFHTGGETVEARSLHKEPGGKGFNQAVACARFGVSVSFLAAVGNDGYAEVARGFLEREGVKACLPEKNEKTAYAAIITDKEGRNRVTVYTGARLTPEDVTELFEREIAAAEYLILGNETDIAVNLRASEIAQRSCTKIIYNPAPSKPLPDELADRVFLFTPNEHETEGLSGRDNCIITLGAHGCRICSTNELIPAYPVAAVDTTGAGDTFNGVLAAALASGVSLRDSVGLAVKASGIGVTRRGAVSSIPYKRELF